MRFRTVLELGGKTATGIRVPAEVVEALGKGKRPPILVTINGYTYRNTIAVYGGEYLVGVSSDHCLLDVGAAGQQRSSGQCVGNRA